MGTKQGNGEATIVQLPSGSYRTQVLVARRRQSITGKTKEEVKRKRRELPANADKGIVPPSERPTVKQWLERCLQDSVRPSVRSATFRSYSTLARRCLVPAIGQLKLTDLQPAHLRQLYAKM